MGSQPATRIVIVCHRIRHLIIFLLFLNAWNYVKLLAEGREIPKFEIEGIEVEANQKKAEENAVMMRLLIGSRPPRCERRCSSCGHCEAVQVPIVPSLQPQQKKRTTSLRQFFATPTIAYSRGDDISNYKPMCWKCKCGNFIFNP